MGFERARAGGVTVTFLGIGKKKDDTKLSSAERYARMAEEAMELGDAAAAVEHYRAALQFAPLSRELRQALADALLEKALAGERRKSGAAPRSSSVLGEVDIPTPAPAPARRKLRPVPEPEPERPVSRAKKAAGPPERSAPRVRSERAPGFAVLDDIESDASEEFMDHDAETPRPRRAAAPASRVSAPSRARVSRRGNGRVWLMAAGYGAVVLIVVGIAHGLISRAIGGDLPDAAETAPAIPEGLSAKLTEAGELLAERKPAEALKVLDGARSEFPDHARTIDPATVQALRAQGSLHLQDRDYAKAADAYERSTRIDPLSKDNWIDLGRALREGGRTFQTSKPQEAKSLLARAASAYERALDVSSKDPAALYGLAQVRIFLNERSKAVDHLKKVIAVAPGTPEAQQAERDLEQLTGSRS